MKKTTQNKKIKREDLIKHIREGKANLLTARFRLTPNDKAKSRKQIRRDIARHSTEISKLAKNKKIIDDVNTNK